MSSRRRKNAHAVAMGRKGGRSRSAAKLAAIRANAQKGGRPPAYKVEEIGIAVQVLRYKPSAGDYTVLTKLHPRALAVLAAWMQVHKPDAFVTLVEDGQIFFETEE